MSGPNSTGSQATGNPLGLGPHALAALARAVPSGPGDPVGCVEAAIAGLDLQLAGPLEAILHHPAFQQLECAWRGLRFLVDRVETGPLLRLEIIDLSKAELAKDVADAPGRSGLGRAVLDRVFGTRAGPPPYAVLIGAYSFDHGAEDVATLAAVATIAGAALTPFLAAAGPALFGLGSWADAAPATVRSEILDDSHHQGWRTLRSTADARFLALCAPGLLSRAPYGDRWDQVEEFAFEEEHRNEPNALPRMNAAFALAVLMARAQAEYGWCTRFRGPTSGGSIEDLPSCAVDRAGEVIVTAVEGMVLEGRLEKPLHEAGLIVFFSRKNTAGAFIGAAPSLYRPQPVAGDVAATAREHFAARLPQSMPLYRIANTLRMLIRDHAHRFATTAALQDWLQGWLDGYVLADPANAAAFDAIARPFAAATVRLPDRSDPAGGGDARLTLRTAFQNETAEVAQEVGWVFA